MDKFVDRLFEVYELLLSNYFDLERLRNFDLIFQNSSFKFNKSIIVRDVECFVKITLSDTYNELLLYDGDRLLVTYDQMKEFVLNSLKLSS